MTTVCLAERQEVVVGEWKHRECCAVDGGERQGRHGGIADCQKVLGEKERSWTKMTCRSTRKAARKHKGLHHAILERIEKGGSKTQRFAPRNSVPFFKDSSVACTP